MLPAESIVAQFVAFAKALARYDPAAHGAPSAENAADVGRGGRDATQSAIHERWHERSRRARIVGEIAERQIASTLAITAYLNNGESFVDQCATETLRVSHTGFRIQQNRAPAD